MLTYAFVQSAIDMWQPDYGYTELLGIGGTFVMGIGSLLVGAVLMVVWSLFAEGQAVLRRREPQPGDARCWSPRSRRPTSAAWTAV